MFETFLCVCRFTIQVKKKKIEETFLLAAKPWNLAKETKKKRFMDLFIYLFYILRGVWFVGLVLFFTKPVLFTIEKRFAAW